MTNIANLLDIKKECSRCGTCSDVCIVNAIDMSDGSRFPFPVIDEKKCIGCSMCVLSCPEVRFRYRKKQVRVTIDNDLIAKNEAMSISPNNNTYNLPVDRDRCCGCTACYAVCPHKAISMEEDDEGFLSPVINQSLCSHCGLCRQVCPVLQPNRLPAPKSAIATWAKEIQSRLISSSGGVFPNLAELFLRESGYVAGAVIEGFDVRHKVTDSHEDIRAMQSSKYVQSDLGDVFQEVFHLLESGKKVLFTGTPCQVAGLRNYLNQEYSNLLTIDLVCHGVPSPGVLKRYVGELRQTYYSAYSCSFRDKVNKWNPSHAFALYDRDGKTLYRERGPFNVYIRGFLRNIFNREGCSSCPFASTERVGDITLGDFWRISQYKSGLDDRNGTSLVFLNTEKGHEAFESIRDTLSHVEEVPLSIATDAQAQLRGPAKLSPHRTEFFRCFQTGNNITDFLEKKLYKVGILNFHFANNFGAVLVPFALSRVVEKMGYTPEIINYFAESPRKNENFENFRKKYLTRSKELYSKEELEEAGRWWKYVIAGSDQVWRLFNTGIYMLNWASGQKTLISYAASFGNAKYAGRIGREEAKLLLKRFDAISVREDSGVKICEETFNIPAVQVLDPTLLLDADDYIKIINENKTKRIPSSKYVCTILLRKANAAKSEDPECFDELRRKYGIVNALRQEGFRPVSEWLEAIKNAEYVVTDSFHGTVFSIIFKKQFICLVQKGFNGQDRIPSLLKSLNISFNRIYSDIMDINEESFRETIDYDEVYKHLDEERLISMDFLRMALSKPPSHKDVFVSPSKEGGSEKNKGIINKKQYNPIKFFKYRLLSKITFGKTRIRYKEKYKQYKLLRRQLKS